jgi:hypothetical protein
MIRVAAVYKATRTILQEATASPDILIAAEALEPNMR